MQVYPLWHLLRSKKNKFDQKILCSEELCYEIGNIFVLRLVERTQGEESYVDGQTKTQTYFRGVVPLQKTPDLLRELI